MPKFLPPLLCLLFAGLTTGSCRADLIVFIEPGQTFVAGSQDNSLDVLLRYDGPDTGPFELSGFEVDLSAPAGSGVAFDPALGVSQSTDEPYLFPAGNFPADSVTPSNSFFGDILISGSQAVNLDDTFGLGRLFLDVDAAASPGTVTLDLDESLSNLFAADGVTTVPFTVGNTSFTVAPAAVPEPGSMFLVLGAVAGAAAARRRRNSSNASLDGRRWSV